MGQNQANQADVSIIKLYKADGAKKTDLTGLEEVLVDLRNICKFQFVKGLLVGQDLPIV